MTLLIQVGLFMYLQLPTGPSQLGFVSGGHLAVSWSDDNE